MHVNDEEYHWLCNAVRKLEEQRNRARLVAKTLAQVLAGRKDSGFAAMLDEALAFDPAPESEAQQMIRFRRE